MPKTNSVSPFIHGAQWVRADFHLHTLQEPGKSRTFRSEYKDRENSFPKEWIAKLKNEQIQVAVVTNHNHFDLGEYKCLRKRGAKEGILVLPGVELGIKEGGGGIHTLIVFDPEGWVDNEQADDRIKRFIDSQFTSTPNEGSRTKDDLCACLEALDQFGHDYFIVFAHVESDNGLLKELDGDHLKHVIERCGKRWPERVLGLQKVKRPELLTPRWPDHISPPACVEGSDPKSMHEVASNSRPCSIKIGELNYASVKFALRDFQQRVTSEPPVSPPHPCLKRISFKGGLLSGQSFPLSDQLTTLIGSRGSGKSSVIECLRFGLELEAGDSDLKYKNNLVSAMLANGGEVVIEGVTADGNFLEITRPLGFSARVKLDGRDSRLHPSDLLPGMLYFGQKDLGHRHEGFENELFSKLLPSLSIEERSMEEMKITAVQEAVSQWQSVLRASEKEEEYAQEEERLRHKLTIYKEKGVETHLKELTTFDTDKRNLCELIGSIETLRGRFDPNEEECNNINREWFNIQSPTLKTQGVALDEIKDDFLAFQKNHSSLLSCIDTILVSLRSILAEVMEQERSIQEKFATLQRDIDSPGINLEEFRQLKSRHEQLVKLLKAAGNRKSMAGQALSQVADTARALHDLWREWHRQEYESLQEKQSELPPSLRLSIDFEDDSPSFKEFLKSKLAGSGFRAASLDKLIKKFRNGFHLFEGKHEIDSLLTGSADVQKCITMINENLADILTFRVPDKRCIWFNEKPIQDLSLGQRATALLQLLMSLKDHPILILDQPEDDLDNETIFKHVVEPLLTRKKGSQFIIATHNPNIPVLGDAELVHACRENAKHHYIHNSGSLDSKTTRTAIVSIMEGGAQAFEQRQKIYTQWTNLH